MKLSDLSGAGELSAEQGDVEIKGLTADSREAGEGFLFAAIAGTKTDGTRFIEDALSKGAAALLVASGVEVNPSRTVPIIYDPNPRAKLARMAAAFYARQPKTVVAVTGTNGKTSVAAFSRQIWEKLGRRAASLGTVGIVSPLGEKPLAHTTPDPVALHKMLAELADAEVDVLALEASSHGLEQYRLDGVKLAAGAFTNITRDHLDYHDSFQSYFNAKLRLFRNLLEPGAAAVINADQPEAADVAGIAALQRLDVFTVGRFGGRLKLTGAERDGLAQRLTLRYGGKTHAVRLPLAGDFQASNALIAAGLVLATGGDAYAVFAALESLKGAKGRLELAGYTPSGAPIFIDYAHTPDALRKALEVLKPYTAGDLVVVFGCGGDRDRGKRPQMGAIAAKLASRVYVTDDNPRSEEPAAIRAEILASAPRAIEIGERKTAIAEAMASLKAGDVLLIAGKGHETGQIIGSETIPYSDHEAVAAALEVLKAEAAAAVAAAKVEEAADAAQPKALAPILPEARAFDAPLKRKKLQDALSEAAEAAEKAAEAPKAALSPLQPVERAFDRPLPRKQETDVPASAPPASSGTAKELAPPLPANRAFDTPLPRKELAEPDSQPGIPASSQPDLLWSFKEIVAATSGSLQGMAPDGANGVSIDSRTLAPGDLFIAIKGERNDGHEYVTSALRHEAAAAIVSKEYFGAAGPLIRVGDTLKALEALGRAARARTNAKIIAVTGSVGKTSTKEMLRLALMASCTETEKEAETTSDSRSVNGAKTAVHASDKSYNNLWGVPLSLARMPAASRYGIFEIGMNHAGEITPLTRMVRPHIAIVTTVAPVHLEFFPDVDAIAVAKAEIFLGLEPGGVAIINRDIRQYALLLKKAKEAGAGEIISFGEYPSADARLVKVILEADRSIVTASVFGEPLTYEIGSPGKHLVFNSLAVLAAVKKAGADAAKAAAALAKFKMPDGRGVRETFDLAGGQVLLIDESYNANPASMRAALAVLGQVPRNAFTRRIAVLGDMLELGHGSKDLHAGLKDAIDEAGIDVVFACGKNMQALYDELPEGKRGAYGATSEDLKTTLLTSVMSGDAVMIKGSLGSRMGLLVGALREHLQALADPAGKRAAQ